MLQVRTRRARERQESYFEEPWSNQIKGCMHYEAEVIPCLTFEGAVKPRTTSSTTLSWHNIQNVYFSHYLSYLAVVVKFLVTPPTVYLDLASSNAIVLPLFPIPLFHHRSSYSDFPLQLIGLEHSHNISLLPFWSPLSIPHLPATIGLWLLHQARPRKMLRPLPPQRRSSQFQRSASR